MFDKNWSRNKYTFCIYWMFSWIWVVIYSAIYKYIGIQNRVCNFEHTILGNIYLASFKLFGYYSCNFTIQVSINKIDDNTYNISNFHHNEDLGILRSCPCYEHIQLCCKVYELKNEYVLK